MITTTQLDPVLKQHIEQYIDRIEDGNLFESIFYCPLSVVEDYIDVLNMIQSVIRAEWIPYIRVASYLGSEFGCGRACKIDYNCNTYDEQYDFQFPSSALKTTFEELQRNLTALCPYHSVRVNLNADYVSQETHIIVNICDLGAFRF